MIFKEPQFKPVPKSGLANVNENIDVFLNSKDQRMIDELLRPCSEEWAHRGYRFVTDSDLTELIITKQSVSGIDLIVVYKRFYKHIDSYSPLCFKHWYTEVTVIHGLESFVYESDVQVKRFIKTLKEKT